MRPKNLKYRQKWEKNAKKGPRKPKTWVVMERKAHDESQWSRKKQEKARESTQKQKKARDGKRETEKARQSKKKPAIVQAGV